MYDIRTDQWFPWPTRRFTRANNRYGSRLSGRRLPGRPQVSTDSGQGPGAGKAQELSHFDASGQAHMVDVGGKPSTDRLARATGYIRMQAGTLALIAQGQAGKGDVLGVARIAAIQGAKRTAELVPLCHPLPITRIEVTFALEPAQERVVCTALVATRGPTGVEMEALTAVQVGLLTIYDMCKAADRGMEMGGIRVLEKHGGASGSWQAEAAAHP